MGYGVLLVLGGVMGCESTTRIVTSDGRPMPSRSHQIPDTPKGVRANQLALLVSPKPEDSNGNGYPDLIRTTVYLFSQPHPGSIEEAGDLVFTLSRPGRSGVAGVAPLGEWRIEAEQMASHRGQAAFGPGYQVSLSLLTQINDRMPVTRADLVCRFEPADGSPPIVCQGVRTIQIGGRM